MNQEQFSAHAASGYNRIPLSKEILADLDTPLSTYLKLANHPYSYLFESVQGGEKWGRYSIIGLPCRTVIRVSGHDLTVSHDDVIVEQTQVEDPLAWIEAYQGRFKALEQDNLPRFCGGLVGYFGYDTVRYIEPRLASCPNPEPLKTPDIMLMLSEEVVVFDNLKGKLLLVVYVDPSIDDAYAKGNKRLDELTAMLDKPLNRSQPVLQGKPVKEEDFISGFSKEAYENAVRTAKQYIVEGDVMQVVLSQRMSIPYEHDPLDLYRMLRSLNPSPYMFYINAQAFHIVGSSPEILVRSEENEITVRPLAGTRPRGCSDEDDLALEQDLLNDPKELAEHLMLIDLGRNDVGRLAEIGSVKLTDKMTVERYSHVMHIVSNVVAKMRPGLSAMDVLRATFPAGTLSGAPKIRAMEIIDELEPIKRGIYSGAVGYVSWSGNMDTAIAIRTAVIKDNTLYIQAGAGIVYDSVPEKEWEESMNKGRAIFKAVEMVVNGLSAGR